MGALIMKKKLRQQTLNVLVIAVVIMIFLPIFLMLPSMFKDRYEIFTYPWRFFPVNWHIDNFRRIAFLQYTSIGINFFRSLAVTSLVAAIALVFGLAINMTAAFAFARLEFPGKKILWVLIISTMFIPAITIWFTSVRVVTLLGLLDTMAVLIIPGLAAAYNIFFFRQFYLGFPRELDEAARIDGAKTYQIFTTIYIPMSKTPMVIIGAMIFMGYYNSYLWPILVISHQRQDLYQMMYVIRSLFGHAPTIGYGAVLAATFISLIPPMIVFTIVQRYIREGIALSGLK